MGFVPQMIIESHPKAKYDHNLWHNDGLLRSLVDGPLIDIKVISDVSNFHEKGES